MYKITLFIIVIIITIAVPEYSFAQRVLFQSDFENIDFSNTDSLPSGWKKLDADSNFFGRGKSWAVRDTNQILGGDTVVNRPRSHSGKKSLHISWIAGKGGTYESDDWVWTDSLRIQSGDSLIFWSLLGNIPGISFYVDSVQIWICTSQSVSGAGIHFKTIKSNLDTNINTWKENKFDLSAYSGQRIFIAFRYYLPVQDALWCNIDDMFIGNRSSTGIQNVSENIPEDFILYQNYPNPFNPVTNLEFGISESGFVSLKVYDIQGKEVKTLVNERLMPGIYKFDFDASGLTNGIYFYTLKVNEYIETKKMLLIK